MSGGSRVACLPKETKRVKNRMERLLLGGLMSAVAFLLDRRLRKLQR
jgi:hypothetical protein